VIVAGGGLMASRLYWLRAAARPHEAVLAPSSQLGLSGKTQHRHRDNLWLLGGEIISDPSASEGGRSTRSCSQPSMTHTDRLSPAHPKTSNAHRRLAAEKLHRFSKSTTADAYKAQAVAMWTRQERCPQPHGRSDKYSSRSRVDTDAKNSGDIHVTTCAHFRRPQIARRFCRGSFLFSAYRPRTSLFPR
jgi:hypothetical protein